jgi:hypothetical protein
MSAPMPAQSQESAPLPARSQTSNLKSEIEGLTSLAESCSRQLRGWAVLLQNTDIAGPRRLTEKSRQAWQARRRAEDFLRTLDDVTCGGRCPEGDAGTPPSSA